MLSIFRIRMLYFFLMKFSDLKKIIFSKFKAFSLFFKISLIILKY